MEVDFKCTMVSQFSDWLHNCLHVPIKGKRRPQEEGGGKNYKTIKMSYLNFL